MFSKNIIPACSSCLEDRKKETQRNFESHLKNIKESNSACFVKAKFQEGDFVEHMWIRIQEVDEENKVFSGYLDNNPEIIKSISINHSVNVPFSEVEEVLVMGHQNN